MFGKFNCTTRAGATYNEDCIFYDNSLLVVVDAATNLNKENLTDQPSDGVWFAKKAVEMASDLLQDSGLSIVTALEKIASSLRHELEKFGCATNETHRFPSGSILVARCNKDEIELYSLGDCTALIEYNNTDSIEVLHDDSVTKLDDLVIKELLELQRNRQDSIKELLPLVKTSLIRNRDKRNKEDGYWIFDPTGVSIEHGIMLCLKKEHVKSLVLMSDGFTCVSTLEKDIDNKRLLYLLKNTPADEMVDRIFGKLDKDSSYNRFPRFKLKDDASVIYADVLQPGQ